MRLYASEAELCATVREAAESLGFEVYPEACGGDLLLVARKDITVDRHGWVASIAEEYSELRSLNSVLAGDTVLVEAKLGANLQLLSQARWPTDRDLTSKQPNYRAAAVPRASRNFLVIAKDLRIHVLETHDRHGERKSPGRMFGGLCRAFRNADANLEIPSLRVEVKAGVPCPRRYSTWKVNAVQLVRRLRAGELLTYKQIEAAGITFSGARNWLERSGQKSGRSVLWKLAEDYPYLPDERYPEIIEALERKEAAD